MNFTYKYQAIIEGRYVWAEKSFKTQADLLSYLVGEKETVLAQKKSIIKFAEGGLSTMWSTSKGAFADKAKPLYENDEDKGIVKRTVVANTYWWMDSHSDVHIGRNEGSDVALFSKSIASKGTKIPPIDQHKWDLDSVMGKTLNIYEAPISWRALGVGKTGMTEALLADVEIQKAKNARRYENYKNDEIDQHSVGMRYIDIQLAVDDPEEYPKEYAVWSKYIAKIGNRQEVEKQGYFFPVMEAELREYSAVISGSNILTPTMGGSMPAGSAKGHSSVGRDEQLLKAANQLLFNLKLNELCQK
jgi:hypothetical protein